MTNDTDALRETMERLRDKPLEERKRVPCPYCGAEYEGAFRACAENEDGSVVPDDYVDFHHWKCGTILADRQNSKCPCGADCYERQLAAQAAEIEKLRTRGHELSIAVEAAYHMLDTGFDGDALGILRAALGGGK